MCRGHRSRRAGRVLSLEGANLGLILGNVYNPLALPGEIPDPEQRSQEQSLSTAGCNSQTREPLPKLTICLNLGVKRFPKEHGKYTGNCGGLVQDGSAYSCLPGLASNTLGRSSNYFCCWGHGDIAISRHRARSEKYGDPAHLSPSPSPSLPSGYQLGYRAALQYLRFSYFLPLRQ